MMGQQMLVDKQLRQARGKPGTPLVGSLSSCLAIFGQLQYDENKAVTLHNCLIQKSWYGEEMEVMATRFTKVKTSPCKFDKLVTSKTATGRIKLQELHNSQHVSITIKTLQIEEKLEVKPDHYKQDATVADATGTALNHFSAKCPNA